MKFLILTVMFWLVMMRSFLSANKCKENIEIFQGYEKKNLVVMLIYCKIMLLIFRKSILVL